MSLVAMMDKLEQNLPQAAEVREFADLEDLVSALEDELGQGVHLLSLEDASLEYLSARQRRLFDAIVYIQGTWELLLEIACDGFYSVFYKCTGAEIERCRTALRRSDDTLCGLFEEAYGLLCKRLDIVPGDNVVTRRPDVSPYELVDEATLRRIEEIENEIEARRMDIFVQAIALYRNAR